MAIHLNSCIIGCIFVRTPKTPVDRSTLQLTTHIHSLYVSWRSMAERLTRLVGMVLTWYKVSFDDPTRIEPSSSKSVCNVS